MMVLLSFRVVSDVVFFYVIRKLMTQCLEALFGYQLMLYCVRRLALTPIKIIMNMTDDGLAVELLLL